MDRDVIKKKQGYNRYNYEASFGQFLRAGNDSPSLSANTIKNYLSDFRHFFAWLAIHVDGFSASQDLTLVSSEWINKYKTYLLKSDVPTGTINRRLSTLRKFFSFAISQGWIKENPSKAVSNLSRTVSKASYDHTELSDEPKRLINDFCRELKHEGFSKGTVNNYHSDLVEFFERLKDTG